MSQLSPLYLLHLFMLPVLPGGFRGVSAPLASRLPLQVTDSDSVASVYLCMAILFCVVHTSIDPPRKQGFRRLAVLVGTSTTPPLGGAVGALVIYLVARTDS